MLPNALHSAIGIEPGVLGPIHRQCNVGQCQSDRLISCSQEQGVKALGSDAPVLAHIHNVTPAGLDEEAGAREDGPRQLWREHRTNAEPEGVQAGPREFQGFVLQRVEVYPNGHRRYRHHELAGVNLEGPDLAGDQLAANFVVHAPTESERMNLPHEVRHGGRGILTHGVNQ